MKFDAKPQSFTLNADGFLRRIAVATILAGASGMSLAQTPMPEGTPAPMPATVPDPITGTTTQTSDAVTAPPTLPSSDVPTTGSNTVDLDKVVVTGSRIRSLNTASVSPVTTVNAAELKYQGTTRVEDLLNSLPQVFADQGGNVSNGSAGIATVNLRGLGSQRTLVLIDGKRVQPGDPSTPSVDINFIPAAMIERVDVLTGGASAVYGADAVAGVVNFQLRKNFEGLRVDVQRSGYQHNNDDNGIQDLNRARGFAVPTGSKFDGQGWDVSALLGVNTDDNRGNLTGYFTYRQINAVTEDQRDYSNCSLGIASDDNYACAGSNAAPAGGRFRRVVNNSPTGTQYGVLGNDFRPYVSTRDAYNFAPFNYFQRNDERYTAGLIGRYKFNDAAEAYTQLMFMDDRTNAVIAPSGSFYGDRVFTIGSDNPFLSASERAVLFPNGGTTANFLLGRRNVEGGGRNDDITHTAYRLLGGLRGDIGTTGFNYDASVQYGVTNLTEVYRNAFSYQRLLNAIDATVDANGNPVCRAGSGDGCVPYNVFQTGGVSPAALAYLQVPALSNGRVEERVATSSVSGIIPGTRLPTANEGIGISGGLEYRQEKAFTQYDATYTGGDSAGLGGARVNTPGQFQVKEVFTEARVPFIQKRLFAYDLSSELGYRHSSYDKFGTTNTFKFGLNYAPVEDFKLRGAFNRAVRAPSIIELTLPQNVVLDGSTDPCAGVAPGSAAAMMGATAARASAAQCARDPYFAADPTRYGTVDGADDTQFYAQTGTSAGLKPERADTVTAGFVFTPRFVKGVNVSVDYYSVRIKNTITPYGEDTILNNCYFGNGSLCGLIRRNAAVGGSLAAGPSSYVIDLTNNTGQQLNQGIDVNANYRTKLSALRLPDVGSVSVDLIATRLLKQSVTPVQGDGSTTYECKGHYGATCFVPNFLYRQKLRTTWITPWYGITASAQWRYFGPTTVDQQTIANGAANNLDMRRGSMNYIDLFVSGKPVQNVTLRAGVNNVIDKRPPVYSSGISPANYLNGNTFSQAYDSLGRYLFAGVQVDFGGRRNQ